MSPLSEGDNWCEKAHITVATPSLSEPNAIRQLLYRESFVLSMRADHPYAKEDMTLERFCELDHVIVSPRSTSVSGPIDDALKQRGLTRRVVVWVPSFSLALQAVRETDLVAALPTRMVRGSSDQFVVKPLPFESPKFDVIATWHPKMRNDPGHLWLRTRLAELSRGSVPKEVSIRD